MNKHKKQSAFTLVELIVVITILAILGTIAFISLQGYSTQARDSTRITDISSIKTTLELFNLESGKYPIPTSGVDITYSGAVVWTQGTFGDSVYKNLSKLDRIPIDPVTDKEYTYSVTANKFKYQIGGIVESNDVGMNNLFSQTNAGEITALAYLVGNYNGQMTKSLSGTTCNILAVPSIITNDSSVTNLPQLVTNNSFVYRGYKNLPSSFKTSKFKYNGGFTFTPNNLIAYTDTGSCDALTSKTTSAARVQLLKGLQDSYTGTILKNEGELKNIMALSINISNPSVDVLNYAGNYINNNLGAKVSVENNACPVGYTGNDCTTLTSTRVHKQIGTTGFWWNYMGGGCSASPYSAGMINYVKKLCKENGYRYDYVSGTIQCTVAYGSPVNSKYYVSSADDTNYTLSTQTYDGGDNYYYFDSVECVPY